MSARYAAEIEAAESLLAKRFATPVHLEPGDVVSDYPGSANAVLRCKVGASSGSAPATVVIKYAKVRDRHLLNEWAALEFLDGLIDARALAPEVYGGDPALELLVIEDLGPSDDSLLGHILDGQTPATTEAALAAFQSRLGFMAEEALLACQQALGRLHAATAGRRGEFARIQQRLGANQPSHHRVHNLLSALADFPRIPEHLGIRPPPELERELQLARQEIREPRSFLAFTHGDATPANTLCTRSGVRLFDWEAAGFRHALLDGSFARLRYLHSVWARRLPSGLQRRMIAAYREELGKGCPEAWDDGRFDRALTACCAAWLAGLGRFYPAVIEQDRTWGRSTLRQRLVAGLDHFAMLSAETKLLPALAATADSMARKLRSLWPQQDCALPGYRAFIGRS